VRSTNSLWLQQPTNFFLHVWLKNIWQNLRLPKFFKENFHKLRPFSIIFYCLCLIINVFFRKIKYGTAAKRTNRGRVTYFRNAWNAKRENEKSHCLRRCIYFKYFCCCRDNRTKCKFSLDVYCRPAIFNSNIPSGCQVTEI
jgi:hypothetical protein